MCLRMRGLLVHPKGTEGHQGGGQAVTVMIKVRRWQGGRPGWQGQARTGSERCRGTQRSPQAWLAAGAGQEVVTGDKGGGEGAKGIKMPHMHGPAPHKGWSYCALQTCTDKNTNCKITTSKANAKARLSTSRGTLSAELGVLSFGS